MTTNIFIIDDDPIYRMIIAKLISKSDPLAVIYQSENGAVGLDCLNAHVQKGAKNIVLLDINMPVLDGWGFLKEISGMTLRKLPGFGLYVVSSSTDQEDIIKAKHYDFLKTFYHKPLKLCDIKMILEA